MPELFLFSINTLEGTRKSYSPLRTYPCWLLFSQSFFIHRNTSEAPDNAWRRVCAETSSGTAEAASTADEECRKTDGESS